MARTAQVKRDMATREMWAEALPAWGSAAAIVMSALVSARMQPSLDLPVHALILIAVLAPLSWGLVTGRISLAREWWPGVLAVTALLVSLSLAFTVSPGRSVHRSLALLSGLAVFASVASSRRQSGPLVCGALAVAGLGVSAIGANEYAVHARGGDPSWRIFSTFFNPGFLSGFLVLAIPATLALLISAKERGVVLGLGFAAVLQFAALSLTGARAGVLAGALGIVVFAGGLLLSRTADAGSWRRIGVTLLIAVALAALIGRPTGQRVASPAGEGHSFAFRKYTWAATARMAAARPITGFGPGAYEVAIPRFLIAGYTRMAHSNYLQVAAESGIPAAVLGFAVWLAIAAASVPLLAKRAVAAESAPFLVAAQAAAAATAIRGAFDSDWWCLPILLAVAATSGIMAAEVTRAADKPESCNGRKAGWLLAAAGASAIALVVMSSQSLAHQARAENAEVAGDWTTAREEWKAAGTAAPWNVRARLRSVELMAISDGTPLTRNTLREYSRLGDLEPTNARIPASLADVLLRLGRPGNALISFRQARGLDPKSPRLLLDEARVLESLGRTDEAMRLWREMLRVENSPYGQVRAIPEMVDATYAWAHAAIGDDLNASGDTRQAIEEWRKAADLLTRRQRSMSEMRAILEAAGMRDPEFDAQARSLLAEVRKKISAARAS